MGKLLLLQFFCLLSALLGGDGKYEITPFVVRLLVASVFMEYFMHVLVQLHFIHLPGSN